MFSRVSCSLPLFVYCMLSLGCGSSVPRDFQVSGKPIEHWLDVIHDPNPALRRQAVQSLGNVGPHHPAAIPALTAALSDSDPAVRAQASLALLKSGPHARVAVPALTAARQDPDPQVRDYATKALMQIGT